MTIGIEAYIGDTTPLFVFVADEQSRLHSGEKVTVAASLEPCDLASFSRENSPILIVMRKLNHSEKKEDM